MTHTHEQKTTVLPAFFTTTIRLSILDRLRVLWHGTIIYRGEIEPDPGCFGVKAAVQISHIRKSKMLKVGFEEIDDDAHA